MSQRYSSQDVNLGTTTKINIELYLISNWQRKTVILKNIQLIQRRSKYILKGTTLEQTEKKE